MGDAASEIADGLHLLRLAELLLGPAQRRLGSLALRDVGDDGDAVWMVEHRHADEDRDAGAVPAHVLVLPRVRNPMQLQLLDGGLVEVVELGRGQLAPPHRARGQFLAGIAGDLEVGIVRFAEGSIQVRHGDADDPGVVQPTEPVFAPAERHGCPRADLELPAVHARSLARDA